jgi:hypothetical protein
MALETFVIVDPRDTPNCSTIVSFVDAYFNYVPSVV